MLEVVEAGALLTIQDRGRPGHAHLGVPPSGAADPWGLAVANLLADAAAGDAALEVTLGGCVLRALESCTIGLGGADLGAERDDGLRLRAEASHPLPRGATVRLPGGSVGLRAYVALAGGIDVPPVLGSASTCVPGRLGFGGGRPLRPGDRLTPRRPGVTAGRTWPARVAPHPSRSGGPLAVVPGPDLAMGPVGALAALAATAWRVGAASDRMGLRLEGRALGAGREIISHPLLPGAIQVPPDGQPIVIGPDGPTIGGYPVVGVVALVERPRLGQLRPGEALQFTVVDAAVARERLAAQRRTFERGAAAVHEDARWDTLAEHAGG